MGIEAVRDLLVRTDHELTDQQVWELSKLLSEALKSAVKVRMVYFYEGDIEAGMYICASTPEFDRRIAMRSEVAGAISFYVALLRHRNEA